VTTKGFRHRIGVWLRGLVDGLMIVFGVVLVISFGLGVFTSHSPFGRVLSAVLAILVALALSGVLLGKWRSWRARQVT